MAEEVTETYASLDNPQEYLVHDFGFHRAVAAASGNPVLAALMEVVTDVLHQRRSRTIDRSHDLKESAEMHRKIYRAIRARDVEGARAAMGQHLILTEQALAAEEISMTRLETVKAGEAASSNGKLKTANSARPRKKA